MNRTLLRTLLLCLFLGSALTANACGDESGAVDENDATTVDTAVADGSDTMTATDTQASDTTTGGDGGSDTTATLDTTTGQDTAIAQDTTSTQDTTTAQDTTTQDTATTTCGAQGERCCPVNVCDTGLLCVASTCEPAPSCTPSCSTPTPGSPDAQINVMTGAAPTLNGGTLADAYYELTSVDLYPDGAFNSALISGVVITSNGNTYGSLQVTGSDWGLDANFDLQISLSVFGQAIDQAVDQPAVTGGCFEVRGNLLVTDLSQCGGQWPGGIAPPGALPFESGSTELKLDLTLSNEVLLASVPPDYQAIAALGITGDLPLIMTFTKQ